MRIEDEIEQAFREGMMQARKIDDDCIGRLLRIMNHYGYDSQREMFIEECAEAIQAAQKCKRVGDIDAFKHFCEEVADVCIMAAQMRLFLGSEKIDKIVDAKLKRQLGRIEDEES